MILRRQSNSKGNRKDMIRQASLLASRGRNEEAFNLFRTSIQTYLDDDLPMRALAAAKAARSALGITPRLQALLIRLYNSVGLCGEADEEIQTSLKYLGLDKISLFQRLNQEETLGLLEAMEVRNMGKMEPVFQQGMRCYDIFIIQSGKFEMYRDQQHLRIMQPGEIFGQIEFFYRSTRSATVRAIEQGSLIRLKYSFLHQIYEKYPAVPHALRTLYTERFIHEPGEDVRFGIGATLPKGSTITALDGIMIAKLADDLAHVTEVTIPKGMAIPAFDGIMILKYCGIVEVDYDQELTKKKFVRPGNVLQFSGNYAMASTNVRLIRAKHKLSKSHSPA